MALGVLAIGPPVSIWALVELVSTEPPKAMATLGTPFRRSRAEDFNIFDIQDDSDDATDSVFSPISDVSQRTKPVLIEAAGNHGVSQPSPDDLASQLEDLHIVTPARINKTRGLKPRPTIDESTFDCPAEEQENSKLLHRTGGEAFAATAPEAPEEGSSRERN